MKSKILDIMATMNNIEYGFKDKTGFNIINDSLKWEEEFNNFYYLQSPEELLTSKCGVCWDQVELERKLFLDNKLKCATYFIFIQDGASLPSHTFLVYKENTKYYWFEHSWEKYQGIHEYNSLEELLKDIKIKFRKDHPDANSNTPIYLYKYEQPPYHITCDDFYEYIETQERI